MTSEVLRLIVDVGRFQPENKQLEDFDLLQMLGKQLPTEKP